MKIQGTLIENKKVPGRRVSDFLPEESGDQPALVNSLGLFPFPPEIFKILIGCKFLILLICDIGSHNLLRTFLQDTY